MASTNDTHTQCQVLANSQFHCNEQARLINALQHWCLQHWCLQKENGDAHSVMDMMQVSTNKLAHVTLLQCSMS